MQSNKHEQQSVEREEKTMENERLAGKKDILVTRRQVQNILPYIMGINIWGLLIYGD